MRKPNLATWNGFKVRQRDDQPAPVLQTSLAQGPDMRVSKPPGHASSSRPGTEENQGDSDCWNQGPREVVLSNHPRHLQPLRHPPQLKHLLTEMSPPLRALPKSLICKRIHIINGGFTPLSFGVVCMVQ